MGNLRTVAAVAALAFLCGCATTQEKGGLSFLAPLEELNTNTLTDAFSGEMREVKRLVDAGSFSEAAQFVAKERSYFSKRLADRNQALPGELQRLGDQLWEQQYKVPVAQAVAGLDAIDSTLVRARWEQQNATVEGAVKLAAALDADFTLQVLRQGDSEKSALKAALARVSALAAASRQQAVDLTFDDVMLSGRHPTTYPGARFEATDYAGSEPFQALARQRLAALADRAAFLEQSSRLAPYLSESSRIAIDQQFIALVRKEMLADGQVRWEELGALLQLRTPFDSAPNPWAGLVRFGHVHLSPGAARQPGAVDFDVPFKQDLPFATVVAESAVLRAADLGGFDYLLVTEVVQAKMLRDFKSKNAVNSRRKTGERQEQNPAYIGAMSAYQQAMVDYQRVQINAAIPRACSGWGCVLHGIADGFTQSLAQKKVDEAAQVLAQTSQTISVPVYSAYDYELVDVDVAKTADISYHIVDVKGRRVLRNSFRLSEQETFRIAYNVHADDPDHSSIRGRTATEEELSRWEKRHVELPMSALVGGKPGEGAGTATQSDLSALRAMLDLPRATKAASDRPLAWERGARQATQGRGGHDASVAAARGGETVAQTIADERFDSIVVIKNASASGTGFYVTPELVLTAHHVVRGNDLAQLSFFDGSKTSGRVVYHDVRLDLALVRAQTAGKPLKIHSGPLRLGETVEAIGHPKGYEFTITRGVVSALRKQRSANIGSESLVEFVQTDTPISPGNSGGPLFLRDAVIGVNDWMRVDKGAQNLNFSVSHNEIRSFLDRFHSTR